MSLFGESKIKYQLPVKGADHKIKEVMGKICKSEKISIEELKAGSRRKEVSKVRARIAIELVKKYGIALAEVARQLGVTTSAISKIMKQAG
jgi:DNA-binding MarR family transcriptional regulator